MSNYILDHWYISSVIFYFSSFVFAVICILIAVKVSAKKEVLSSVFEEISDVAGVFIVMMFIPFINLLISLLFIVMGIGTIYEELKDKKDKKKKRMEELNQFYKTNCCDVLVRLHHVYRYNESLDNKSVKKCVACKKDITIENLKIYNDEDIAKNYESKIPYQTILTKKEFDNLEDTISNQKSKSLFEEEEAKYIKLSMDNLENKK